MARGLEIKLSDLNRRVAFVQLFNGQCWRIDRWRAFRYSTMFVDGKPMKVDFAKDKTKTIYPDIKFVFDENGKTVAQRLNRNCRLLTTSETKWYNFKKDNNSNSIYGLLQSLENKEYEKKMNDYIRGK